MATYWEVLPGHENELRAATERFAAVLHQVPPEKNIHTGLRDQRHVIFDNEQRLMWATTFENEWDPYFDDFILIGIEHFLDAAHHPSSSDAGPAARRSPWPRTRTTPNWAPTPHVTTPSCTATTRGASSARSARTPGG